MRITLAAAKKAVADLPTCNMSESDPRIIDLINEAQERIVEESESEILHKKIRLCVDESCVTTPAGTTAFTDLALCESPIPVRNSWYEFLPDGYGVYTGDPDVGRNPEAHYQGECCTFKDINGNKKLKIYRDIAEDPGSYLYLFGIDDSGRIVRTIYEAGLDYADGERIDLGEITFPITTATTFQSLIDVQKPRTRGPIRCYSYDPVTTEEVLIAVWDHWETKPAYNRYIIRNLPSCGTSCGYKTVTGMVKLEFIPAVSDTDVLVVPSLNALRAMCQAIISFRNNLADDGVKMSRLAMRRMALQRNHRSPKEQVAIRLRPHGSAVLWHKQIGGMK